MSPKLLPPSQTNEQRSLESLDKKTKPHKVNKTLHPKGTMTTNLIQSGHLLELLLHLFEVSFGLINFLHHLLNRGTLSIKHNQTQSPSALCSEIKRTKRTASPSPSTPSRHSQAVSQHLRPCAGLAQDHRIPTPWLSSSTKINYIANQHTCSNISGSDQTIP